MSWDARDARLQTCAICGHTGWSDAHSPTDICGDCERASECDHEWRFVEHAYEGDPNVPNGTRDFKVFRCDKCGEEENRT